MRKIKNMLVYDRDAGGAELKGDCYVLWAVMPVDVRNPVHYLTEHANRKDAREQLAWAKDNLPNDGYKMFKVLMFEADKNKHIEIL